MRKTTCLFSSAAALHRVFIAPIEYARPHQYQRALQTTSPFLLHQRRTIATSAPADKRVQRLPRDEEITGWTITLISEDNTLSNQTKSAVLARIDPLRQSLIQVKEQLPGELPLCKIVDKKKLFEQAKKRKENEKTSKVKQVSKVVELNWAIGEGDLSHKLDRLKEFLEKGWKVEVVIAVKRKGKIAVPEQAQEVVRRIKEVVDKIDGTRETAPREGEVGKEMKFHFEGKAPKVVPQKPVKLSKQEEKELRRKERAEKAALKAAAAAEAAEAVAESG